MKIFRILAPKLRLPINDISNVSKQYDLDKLFKLRFYDDVNYVYKLMNNEIDCSDLLTKIKFEVHSFLETT